MKVKLLSTSDNWLDVKNAALTTIGKNSDNIPSSDWKRRLLLSEHSPIRKFRISWKWIDLMYWVSVHIVRHKIGIEHWIKTQRSDRTGINRSESKQDELVNHECEANAQSIIYISRKRLCTQASKETKQAWKTFLDSFGMTELELHSVCVPDCIYRGHCYEYESCGYHRTEDFKKKLQEYREGINGLEE